MFRSRSTVSWRTTTIRESCKSAQVIALLLSAFYHCEVWVLIDEIAKEGHLAVEVLCPDFSDDGSLVWAGHGDTLSFSVCCLVVSALAVADVMHWYEVVVCSFDVAFCAIGRLLLYVQQDEERCCCLSRMYCCV